MVKVAISGDSRSIAPALAVPCCTVQYSKSSGTVGYWNLSAWLRVHWAGHDAWSAHAPKEIWGRISNFKIIPGGYVGYDA